MLRSTPLRISRSSVRTCRFLISRSAMVSCSSSGRERSGGHVDRGSVGTAGDAARRVVPGERGRRAWSPRSVRTIEPRTRVHSSLVGQTWSGSASRAHTTMPSAPSRDALDRGDRALQRLDHLGHRDLVGRARQQVAAARAAPAVDQPRLAQAGDEVLEVGERQPVALGDLRERTPAPRRAPRERARPSRARRTRPWWRTSSSKTYLES